MYRRPAMTVRCGMRRLARSAGFGLLLLANGCLFTDPILGTPGPNQTPQLTVQPNASATPIVLTADAKVMFIAHGHDPDGSDSALAYQWLVDGALANGGFGATSTYNLDASILGAGAHTLQVTVTDPLGASQQANWNLQVQ